MVVTTAYCFNDKLFFYYPISLLLIFISNFINFSGALYLKTFELSLITNILRMPLSTITNLFIFNIIIIISHYFYRNIKLMNDLNGKFRQLILKFDLDKVHDLNFLYILSIIAVLVKLLTYDLSTSINMQSFSTGPGLLQDFLNGFKFLFYLPISILFYQISNNLNNKKFYIFFIVYIITIFFISLSINNRSVFFDAILLIFIIFFLNFLFSEKKNTNNSSFGIIIIFFITFQLINFLENFSRNYALERNLYFERSPIENFYSFFKNQFNEDNTQIYDDIIKQRETFFSEQFYKKSIFNRINILIINDNLMFSKSQLSSREIKQIQNLQMNQIISVIPQPIINIFTNNFNKTDYTQLTVSSYIYGLVDFMYGNKSIGSVLMTLFIIFDKYLYLVLLFLFIPFFAFFDSFYNKDKRIFSPYILMFFYTTSFGLLNILSTTDFSNIITLTLRAIPQTMLYIIIINFFYKNIFKKKNLK